LLGLQFAVSKFLKIGFKKRTTIGVLSVSLCKSMRLQKFKSRGSLRKNLIFPSLLAVFQLPPFVALLFEFCTPPNHLGVFFFPPFEKGFFSLKDFSAGDFPFSIYYQRIDTVFARFFSCPC